ncbi:MAG: carboxymuconolactone decarboxylase family protein [Acidimicrobiales bacterium]
MNSRPLTPRIPPLAPEERGEAEAELLRATFLPDANIFSTLVRTPKLFRKWLPFGGQLLNGSLPARDREILILRTGWNCQSEYEWSQHVILGRRAGLSDAEIRRITSESSDDWEPLDSTLLRAADELHDQSFISNATWDELADHYDVEQLIELPMLVGHYHLVAMTLNSLGVALDEGLEGFPDDPHD